MNLLQIIYFGIIAICATIALVLVDMNFLQYVALISLALSFGIIFYTTYFKAPETLIRFWGDDLLPVSLFLSSLTSLFISAVVMTIVTISDFFI